MTEAVAPGVPAMRAQAPVLVARRPIRKIRVDSLNVGGDIPITVQSMTTTKTHNIGATLQQIVEPTAAGCDIARMACPTNKDAEALLITVKQSRALVITDIHFNPKYVFAAIGAGCGVVRVNPDNIRKFDDQVVDICKAASNAGVSLHIGVNAGSLDKRLLKKYERATPEVFMESATWEAGLFEENNFHDLKISVKYHGTVAMVQAYRPLSEAGQQPLHLGVTEVDPMFQGMIKFCIVLGALLAKSTDNTTRVLLSIPPAEEAKMGTRPLEFMGLHERQLEIVSCPSYGWVQADVWTPAEEVGAGLKEVTTPLRVAVMGCVVSDPGEAHETDLGYASGNGKGQIFVRGQVAETVSEDQVVETLFEHAEAMATKMAERFGEEALVSTSSMVSTVS